mmetsp:Transcript_56192/g.117533  ORF Transcript_56192/g.117533 Transcript_56192/m.117533 type:complete len:110 (-) Transcript_56192:62-391(-)
MGLDLLSPHGIMPSTRRACRLVRPNTEGSEWRELEWQHLGTDEVLEVEVRNQRNYLLRQLQQQLPQGNQTVAFLAQVLQLHSMPFLPFLLLLFFRLSPLVCANSRDSRT